MLKYIKMMGVLILGMLIACSNGSETSGGSSGGGGNGSGNTYDISGRWYVKVKFSADGKANPFVADVEQSDTSFTGVISWGTSYLRSFSGVIIGSDINFASQDDTLHFEGKIEASDSIDGTWYNKFTSDSGTWYAVRPMDNYNIEGEYTGRFMFLNGTSVDTTFVQNGVWKGKAFTALHGDTTYFAGEMLSVADGDTVSPLVPMGGFMYNDTLFIDFGCTINNINGRFYFWGRVNGDSATGEWYLSPLSGYSMLGDGEFSGNISAIVK